VVAKQAPDLSYQVVGYPVTGYPRARACGQRCLPVRVTGLGPDHDHLLDGEPAQGLAATARKPGGVDDYQVWVLAIDRVGKPLVVSRHARHATSSFAFEQLAGQRPHCRMTNGDKNPTLEGELASSDRWHCPPTLAMRIGGRIRRRYGTGVRTPTDRAWFHMPTTRRACSTGSRSEHVAYDWSNAASGKIIIAMPAIEVAKTDAQPDRNSPSTCRERARITISRMSGGAVSPLKIADR